jgi:hypothetical protein
MSKQKNIDNKNKTGKQNEITLDWTTSFIKK